MEDAMGADHFVFGSVKNPIPELGGMKIQYVKFEKVLET